MSEATPAEEETARKRALNKIYESTFDPRPVAEYLCHFHKVPNLTALCNRPNGLFGSMPDAWSLMQERTVGVEIGSVKHAGGAPVPLKARLDEDRLQQKVVCALRPGNETRVRFLDEPNHGKKWEHPFSKELIDGDLEKVSLFSCIFCHRWSSFPIHWDVSMGHVHSGLDQLFPFEAKRLVVCTVQ